MIGASLSQLAECGLKLFEALFKQNYQPAYEEVIKAASIDVINSSSSIRCFGLGLFEALVKHNYQPAYEEAIKVVPTAILSPDYHARFSGFDLLVALIENVECKQQKQEKIKELIATSSGMYGLFKPVLEDLLSK